MSKASTNLKETSLDENSVPAPAPIRSGLSAPRFTLKPTRQTCIALGVMMGVCLVASGGLYAWQEGQIGDLRNQVRVKQNDLNNSEKIAKDLETVKLENTQTRSELRFLETSVSAGEYVPTLLKQTEDLAKSTNLHVGALRPTLEPAPVPPTDKEQRKKFVPQPYNKLKIDLDVSGKYWDVAQMLYKLTDFPKILTVDTIQVTPDSPKPGQVADLKVSIKLTGFIFPNDGTDHQTSPVAPLPPTSRAAEASKKTAATGAAPAPATAPAATTTVSAASTTHPAASAVTPAGKA